MAMGAREKVALEVDAANALALAAWIESRWIESRVVPLLHPDHSELPTRLNRPVFDIIPLIEIT